MRVYWVFAISLSIAELARANTQLSCNAGRGSVLQFLMGGKSHSIDCVSNSTDDFQVTEDQYEDIITRLRTTEEELSETRLALTRLMNKTTPERDTSENRTLQLIDEAVNRAIAKLLPKTTPQEDTVTNLLRNGWVRSGSYLFFVSSEQVDYHTARRRCQDSGGALAAGVLRHPDSVRDIISRNIVKVTNRGPWIGLDDIKQEGVMVWADGGSTSSATTEWLAGEPNNNGGDEDCVNIVNTENGKLVLNDLPCSLQLNYICEMRV